MQIHFADRRPDGDYALVLPAAKAEAKSVKGFPGLDAALARELQPLITDHHLREEMGRSIQASFLPQTLPFEIKAKVVGADQAVTANEPGDARVVLAAPIRANLAAGYTSFKSPRPPNPTHTNNTPTTTQASECTPSGLFETTGAFFQECGTSGDGSPLNWRGVSGEGRSSRERHASAKASACIPSPRAWRTRAGISSMSPASTTCTRSRRSAGWTRSSSPTSWSSTTR